MKQKSLARWLKVIIIGIAVCGAFIYGFIIPAYGKSIAVMNPEMAYRYVPWLVFLLITAVPCYAALVIAWRIASDIGRDMSFTRENAKRLKRISLLAAVDAAYFFIGNVVLLFLNMSHPGIVLFSIVVVFAGVAISVAAAALSHLVMNAAELKEQSDLTI